MLVKCTCLTCGRYFHRSHSYVVKYKALYCSTPCRYTPPPPIFNDDGLTASIPLQDTSGEIRAYTIIDRVDADWVSQWQWHLNDGYARRNGQAIDGSREAVMLHRELMGLKKGDIRQVDHINRNRIDNRRSNLRMASLISNPQNQPSHRGSTSKYRGVSWNTRKRKWVAQLSLGSQSNRKSFYVGSFTDEQEAAAAISAARQRLMPFAVD